ncbi:MAG: hypothetical protein HY867_17460 [Chloroflexi bacterium]|nr:hypothetical protein [Chloroflexota bacterium]
MTSKTKSILFFVVSTVLLFLGFDRNFLHLVPAEAFANFDKGSESLVIGRIVWTQQRGLFSDGALLGTGDAPTPIIGDAEFDHQYKTYLADGEFSTYMIYKSQSGGQGWVFSLLDSISPFSASTNLRLFRVFTALLSALTIAALLAWFHSQFGLVVASTVLLTSLVSQWLTLYGRNLFYSVWDYFLPMVAALYFLDRESRGRASNERVFYATVGALLFLKGFLSGYDFLLPPMGMVATALIYYALKDKWGLWQFTRRLLWTGLACAVGVLASFAVLAAQIGSVTGNFSDGFLHIVNTMGRRTFGTPLDPALSDFFRAGQEANVLEVIRSIAGKTAIVAGIRFTEVFVFFAVATVLVALVLFLRGGKLGDTFNAWALLIATWVSFLSPLTWLAIFKAHAYYHPFTSAIVWHMPTMFFGYALCGLLITLLFRQKSQP